VFSILHPCFPGWGPDVSGSWPTGRGYYQEGWWRSEAVSSGIRRRVGANHRTLSTYLNALAKCHLALQHAMEPSPPWAQWRSQQPDQDPVPVFFVARCQLVPAAGHPPTA
jgi:hypothetical protein